MNNAINDACLCPPIDFNKYESSIWDIEFLAPQFRDEMFLEPEVYKEALKHWKEVFTDGGQ